MLDFVPLTRSQNTECLQAVRSCLQINLGIFPRCRRCSAEPSCSSPTEDIWESALHRMAYLKWIMRNRCVASHSVFWIIWGGFVSAFPSLTTWCHSSRTDAGVLLTCGGHSVFHRVPPNWCMCSPYFAENASKNWRKQKRFVLQGKDQHSVNNLLSPTISYFN